MKTANLTLRGAALATVIVLGATACGSGDSSSSTANPKVTVILGTASDSFYNTLGCGAKAEGKKLGATVDVQGATTFDPATQTPILTSTVAKKPNAVVIAPTDSKALGTPLKQANEAGIKIVTADTGLDDTSFVSSAVSSNNVEGGAVGFDAGPAQVEQLKKGTVQALIAQKAEEIGAQAVRQAVNAIQGKKVTKSIGTSFVSITAANLGDANVSKYVYRSSC